MRRRSSERPRRSRRRHRRRVPRRSWRSPLPRSPASAVAGDTSLAAMPNAAPYPGAGCRRAAPSRPSRSAPRASGRSRRSARARPCTGSGRAPRRVLRRARRGCSRPSDRRASRAGPSRRTCRRTPGRASPVLAAARRTSADTRREVFMEARATEARLVPALDDTKRECFLASQDCRHRLAPGPDNRLPGRLARPGSTPIGVAREKGPEAHGQRPCTSTGVGFGVAVVPSPTWPFVFSPQQKTPPLVRAQVCAPPASTSRTVLPSEVTSAVTTRTLTRARRSAAPATGAELPLIARAPAVERAVLLHGAGVPEPERDVGHRVAERRHGGGRAAGVGSTVGRGDADAELADERCCPSTRACRPSGWRTSCCRPLRGAWSPCRAP